MTGLRVRGADLTVAGNSLGESAQQMAAHAADVQSVTIPASAFGAWDSVADFVSRSLSDAVEALKAGQRLVGALGDHSLVSARGASETDQQGHDAIQRLGG